MNLTEKSIAEQFGLWKQALRLGLHPADFRPKSGVVVGCGTSYYLAQTIAAVFNASGQRAVAVPGAEWVSRWESYLPQGEAVQVVALSRSGETSETLEAARLSQERGMPVLGLTCAPGSSLEKLADATLYAQTHPEEGIVMTASASLLLLMGLALARQRLSEAGVEAAKRLLEQAAPKLEGLIAGRSHFVYLGSGPLYGIANEGALKLMEMSLSYAQAYHPLEYRHGPVSLVDERTLAVMLYHPGSLSEEGKLVRELQDKGAKVIGMGGPGDLSLELPDSAPALRGLVALPTLQWLGERVAQSKGLDTRTPRHLTKVVML